MVNLTIDSFSVSVPEGSTILEAARVAGVHIPHLCYLKGINEIGACRVCCVEVEGEQHLIPACDNVVREGMHILTTSPRARAARRTNLQLIMSQHNCDCAVCARSGNCQLQSLANDFGMLQNAFPLDLPAGRLLDWDASFPLIRDAAKCIKCMRCIQVCDKIQTLSVWDLAATGGRTHVDVAGSRSITTSDCSLCGQCITHCPVGALRERDDVARVMRALEDPEITTVIQIAPAVRTAWGESLGKTPEETSVNRLAGALRMMGFDYVFDTTFSADLTIMEEGNELLARMGQGKLAELPMFTSCCPGWVRFLKGQYPELTPCLSSAKSPQQMFGAVVKSYFAEKIGVAPEKIFCVSVMPCVAKKSECDLPTMKRGNVKDVDCVLTTREAVRMLKAERVSVRRVKETPFDNLLGDATGAGVIFGATGGVMEAALRSAYYLATGKNPAPEAFSGVRAAENTTDGTAEKHPWREAAFDLAGTPVRVAVTSGLGNARELCKALLKKQVHYDFVEIMACPGGCSGGGGQPIHCDDVERAEVRGQVLYGLDRTMPVRFSHENKDVQRLYNEYLDAPLSAKAEILLHTDHNGWQMPGEN